MSDKRVFRITPTNRRHVAEQVSNLPEGWFVYAKEDSRSLEQNAAQWPILEAFSKQRQWPVNGVMSWLTKEEWKDILTATFEQELQPRLAAGVNGGVVMLGRRTREYGKKKFSEWLDFLHATAVVLGVQFNQNEKETT